MPVSVADGVDSTQPGLGFAPVYSIPGNPANPSEAPDPVLPLGAGILDASILTDNQIEDPRPAGPHNYSTADAALIPSNDWYMEKWWFFPDPLAFGAIASDKTLELGVLNTYRDQDYTLDSIDFSALSGVSQTGEPALPVDIFSRQQITLNILATLAGDPAFDDNAIFSFSNIDQPLRVTGERVVVFPYLPQRPITEQLLWLTDIFKSRNKTEQRFSLRPGPRQRVTMRILLREPDSDFVRIMNTIQTSFASTFALPIWWEQTPVTAAAAADSLTVNVSTLYSDFRAGSLVLFELEDGTRFDATVASLDATSLTLTDGLPVEVPFGSLVVPMRLANLTTPPATNDPMFGAREITLTFETRENTDLSDIGPFSTFNGVPLLDMKNQTGGAARKSVRFDSNRSVFDPKIGSRHLTKRELLGSWSTENYQYLESRQAIWQWRQLLHYLRGSWSDLYMPTFRYDMVLASDFDLASTQIIVETNRGETLGNIAPRDAVFIELADGRQYARSVSSYAGGTPNDTVNLSSSPEAVPEVIPAANVRVSWLPLSRLRGDVATFLHRRVGEAELRFEVEEVQA